ncbi:hypothetical protein I204_00662 [Kwoniella mangroviensis CBS 8886]|uniref:uncharacterized protein n=1 Tax=Kwoniella mangroviensis CBS 8507 TaxID=1296122 RepID=UPI00080D00AD|nr:uncharacterized protein I203_07091 [Kwoniella mangroviensis CBS 8507]OCF63772.1 hypothetical protein I203_07091 [Kwoniella mangroviensis CBS 8507]OCF78718.1 hypothetical protein I204_00662 [Kwoniella mangroviensis CBS 8886]
MQARPTASGPGPSTEYHPPLAPSIPLSAINTLIPRLTTTINDIDSLRNLIASGYNDGTLPTWDTLLQRYSLLLGRINALTNYLSPPNQANQPNKPSTSIAPLSGYLIHPLNPIPPPGPGANNDISPLAQETFLQAINTQLLPSDSVSNEKQSQGVPQSQSNWHSIEELRRLDERSLELLKRQLRERLNRENLKIDVIKREIERREEEVDWAMRIGEDDEEEEEEEKNKEGEEGGEEEDDLFGGDDDDATDEPMVIDVDAHADKSNVPQPEKHKGQGDGEGEGNWKVEDFLKFMDTGKLPLSTDQ